MTESMERAMWLDETVPSYGVDVVLKIMDNCISFMQEEI